MADDIEQNITITAESEGAVETLQQVDRAFQGINETHDEMRGRFGQAFQHAGVHLFARDMGQAVGLGHEARLLFPLLNTSLSTLLGTFGTAATIMAPYLIALGVLAGLLITAIKHHKDHAKALDDEIKAIDTNVKSMQDMEDQVLTVNRAYGTWSKEMINFVSITEKVKKESLDEKRTKIIQEIEAINSTIERHQMWVGMLNTVKDAISSVTSFIDKYTHAIRNLMLVYENFRALIRDVTGAITDHFHKAGAAADAFTDKAHQKIAALKLDLASVKQGYNSWADEASKAQEKINSDLQKTQEHHVKLTSMIQGPLQHAFEAAMTGGKQAFEQIEKDFLKMAESMIAKLITLIAMWTIFDLVSGGGAAGEGGLGDSFGGFLKKGMLGFATGGDTIVDQPTHFMAGEGGQPERVQVTPMGGTPSGQTSGQSSSGAGSLSIGQIVIQGIQDPKAIAQAVGDEIIKNVRGRGNLAFSRPN